LASTDAKGDVEPVLSDSGPASEGARWSSSAADEIMAEIVAKRLVESLERAGFVILKKPAAIGPLQGRGFEGWRPTSTRCQ
jgi:hypothetical protein